MRVKNNRPTIQEDSNYVFALFPDQLKERYIDYIKTPLEKIENSNGRIVCQSYLDFQSPSDVMSELWKGIARAKTIIVDITGFVPNVMYELGVTLTNKENVVVICEQQESEKNFREQLPFNLAHIKVEFYDTEILDELSDKLTVYVEKYMHSGGDVIPSSNDFQILFNKAKTLIDQNMREAAEYVYIEMDRKFPKNSYIHRNWGKLLVSNGKYDDAQERFKKALKWSLNSYQRALVHIEEADLFEAKNDLNKALVCMEKAENESNQIPTIYEKWALYLYKIGSIEQSMYKLIKALPLRNSNMNKKRLVYFILKWTNPNLRVDLNSFLKKWQNKSLESFLMNPQFGKKGKSFPPSKPLKKGEKMTGVITNCNPKIGVFVMLNSNFTGLIHKSKLDKLFHLNDIYKKGARIRVEIANINGDKITLKTINNE